MSKANGSTAEAIDLGALIEGARGKAAEREETRIQQEADDSLQAENESLKSQLQAACQEIEDLKAKLNSSVVSCDQDQARLIAIVFDEIGDLLFLPNGDLRDLKSLREQILMVQGQSENNGTMPTSPPTAPADPEDPPAKKRGLKYLGPLLRGAPVSQPTTQKGR